MKRKILVSFIIFISISIYSQDRYNIEKKNRNNLNIREKEAFLAATETGIGVGFKLRKTSDEINYWSFTIQAGGARDKDEVIYYDYWGRPYKFRDFFTVLVPLTVGYQRRLGTDSIEDNLRPFVNFDVGPIIGWSIPTGEGFVNNVKRSTTEVTVGGFIGTGVEYFQKDGAIFTFNIGYRISYFFEKVSKEKNYSMLFIKIGIASAL